MNIFICRTPAATNAGSERFASPSIPSARQALHDAGYGGQKVVVLDPVDYPVLHAITLVTADRLISIGFNVDVQAMDWAQVVARRSNREDPAKSLGGWNVFHTTNPAVTMNNPISNYALSTGCNGKNWFGWPCDEQLEHLRLAFALAATDGERSAAREAIQLRYWEVVPYVALG